MSVENEQADAGRDGCLRRERAQKNIHFPYSRDHKQDWQPFPFDPYSYVMTIHTTSILCTSATCDLS